MRRFGEMSEPLNRIMLRWRELGGVRIAPVPLQKWHLNGIVWVERVGRREGLKLRAELFEAISYTWL